MGGVQEGPPQRLGAALGWGLALAAAAGAAGFAALTPMVSAGGAAAAVWPWVERLDVALAFRVDGLSLIFALLICGFGAMVALYAGRYLRGHPHLARFFIYLAVFMAGMLGLVLADDLILLFAFWEATTIASFLLVGFDHASAKARRSAWQALLITGGGGLALLAGLALLGIAAGTTRISEITAGPGLGGHPLYPAILTLVLIGAFAKSAQFPFHIWLPNAMAAPTPVSAYLHSATMVKAGVYLLARLHPTLSGTDAWVWSLSAAGGVTMLLASVLALRQTDLKLALAYTSVMALGTLVMFLGAEAPVAVAAALTFLIVHALYKAALFLVVGAIDHATGTREIGRLGGLWRRMPMTSAAAVLAAGSMAGFPPFLGFIGKELKYEGALAISEEPALLAGAAVAANAMMAALALVIVFRVILGREGEAVRGVREAPARLWIGPALLAAAGLACGLAPDLIGRLFVQPAAAVVLGAPADIKLKLWHGVNVPLAMSVATMALGALLFAFDRRVRRTLARLPARSDRIWDAILAGLASGFAAVTRAMQPGSLRVCLGVSIAVMTGAPLLALILGGGLAEIAAGPMTVPPAAAIGAAALAVAGAGLAAASMRRMAAVGGLAAVGTGLAMLFVVFGAPDVAITQLLADVLLVVLIAAVMSRLPDLGPRREGRGRDLAVAAVAGASVAALTLAATAPGFDRSVADAMTAMSVPDAKGRNIVNVVLVDFRALDTFGEIVVIAAAALGAGALIRGRRARPEGAA